MPKQKEPDFVVSDRRKFTSDGDLRTDSDARPETEAESREASPPPTAPPVDSEKPAFSDSRSAADSPASSASAPTPPAAAPRTSSPSAPAAAGPHPTGGPGAAPDPYSDAEVEVPPPPSAAEQQEQQDAYRASGKELDAMMEQHGARTPQDFEMNFERVIASLYMTAMMQLGVMRTEGEQPRVDLIGARQTIDTIGVLNDKTKGNLTAAEQALIQNCLFELRMAFLELTNAITRAPAPGQTAPPAGGIIK